jgi:putative nucleotidyltransferase with HDIG domain
MAQKNVDATASRKVELAVGELAALSVPPCVAVQYLSKMLQGRFSAASVADIAECEPVLAAELIALAQRRGSGPAEQRHAIRLILDRLDAGDARDTLLGTKVTAAYEIEFAEQEPVSPSRKDLTLHSLAVAIAARRIAEAAQAQVDPALAYSAGLLHDIGKFALQEIMPRSLAAISKEAAATHLTLYAVEQQHLGTNHALLGKYLAQRWRLPEAIGLAIWLHHADPASILDTIPAAEAALPVWAANHIAHHARIGDSGSHESPPAIEDIAQAAGLDAGTLRQIREELPGQVQEKVKALGFDLPDPTARYCDLIQTSAAELSKAHTQLALESRDSQMAVAYLDFARGFLRDARPDPGAIYAAEDFARRWQRFFQTGSVCLFWPGAADESIVEAVVVEALGQSRKIVLETPPDGIVIPPSVATKPAPADAHDHIDWLLEQLEVDFDSARTKLMPLFREGQPIAVIAFELNYPGDTEYFADKFEMAASMASAVLGLALARQRQERVVERLAQVKSQPAAPAAPAAPAPAARMEPVSCAEALVEMAAGVAHELNNPLSVIAGRAQLLAQAETDGQKRHVLDVIGENARDASGIVNDLMSYARPETPRPAKVGVAQILDEAVQLAARKLKAEHINAQIQAAEGAREAFVDSAQVVSALANVIANSVESYADALGPVQLAAEPAEGALRVRISDLGRGMDAETLRKVAYPFFSAKPAGRRRGMGLAYAARLIELNRGTLAVESHPDHGTTVTITLPLK